MRNNKYSVIVFDLGNVLIPFDYDLIIKKLNDVEYGLGNKFYRFYESNYDIHRKFERGDMPEQEFLRLMLNAVENKIDSEAFCHIYSEIFIVNEQVASLLPVLREKYMLVLLSNTNSIHRKYGWNDNGFLRYFDKLVLSYEVNAIKPEKKIYRAVEKFTTKLSSEHIFIDDVVDYVEGAKKVGWDAVQFTGYEKLLEDLRARNII